ncbi:MAG TPA: response regulator [Phycisphaerales bacterium]|nr:response regulator [Phycisphaerales bacterium]
MVEEVVILMAEDDEGHAGLIRRNLQRAGISNEIVHFKDGGETIDFLRASKEDIQNGMKKSFLLLLDIRMPKVGGVEVLKFIKADDDLKSMPVLMLTTTDDPKEVKRCHELGCSHYITKPIEYSAFVEAVQSLGLFLKIVKVPEIG